MHTCNPCSEPRLIELLVLLALSLPSIGHAQAPEPSPPPPSAESPSAGAEAASAAPKPGAAAPQPPAYNVAVPADDSELPQQPNYQKHRQRRSFVPMVVGFGVLLGGYAFSAAVGARLESDETPNCLNCKYGSRLFIPILGPWLLLPDANGSAGKALTAVMGAIQGAGLLLSIYGVARFVSTGQSSDDEARAERFNLAFTPLHGGGYAGMQLRW
jgi:hypothetical protein